MLNCKHNSTKSISYSVRELIWGISDYNDLKYKGEDTEAGEKTEMTKKKGDFKAKAVEKGEDFIQHAEEDMEFVGFDWLKKKLIFFKPEKIIEMGFEELKENYEKSNPRDVVNSELIGFSSRKGQVKNVKIDESKIPSITPLIAKIVVFYLNYFLHHQIDNIHNYKALIDHARNNQAIKNYTINWLKIRDDKVFYKWYGIRMFPNPGLN